MSSLPLLVRHARFGTALGSAYQLEDHIKTQVVDSCSGLTMQETAERLAGKYHISRQEADEFAYKSVVKWKAAQQANVFEDEMISLTVDIKNKSYVIDKDDIAHNLKLEEFSRLPPLLENGSIITAGNSAAPADGAAALLIASEEAVKLHRLRPLARVTGWATVGTDPKETGVGAEIAINKLLENMKRNVEDVDLFEINETFASQTVATARNLNIVESKVNVSGGAIAMGHPVAATGARMVTHLVHQISGCNLRSAVAASSCGGGQGVAIMLENI